MIYRTKYIQLLVILALIPAFAIIWFNVSDNIAAIAWNIGLLIIIWLFRIISNKIKYKQFNRIIDKNKKTNAQILSKKVFKNNTFVLQLNVSGAAGSYITSYVHRNPDEEQMEKYQEGNTISVFVNPLDQNDIFIRSAEKQKTRSSEINWGAYIYVIVIGLSVGLPLVFTILSTSDRIYKDAIYIAETESQGKIWELRYKSPKKIFIQVIDPKTNKTIKKIKEVKETEHDYYLDFSICQQGQNVVIVGKGTTPIFDVYDAISFEKKLSIRDLEKSYKKLESGIVKINEKANNSKFVKDNFIELIATDGSICFYNIQKELFFDTEKAVNNYFENTQDEIFSENPVVFALSPVPGSSYQDLLYVISSSATKNLDELLRNAGNSYFDQERFNQDKRYNCKKCTAKLLMNEYFLESKFIYYDTSMAVVESLTSMKNDADEKITAIDKNGKILFEIPNSNYPNIDLMIEDDYRPKSYSKLKLTRIKGIMILYFDKYGAIGIDLSSGKEIWKYESE